MQNAIRKVIADLPSSGESPDLYLVPSPAATTTTFCSLAARALHCRTCHLVLVGPDGNLIVSDAVGRVPEPGHQIRMAAVDRAADAIARPPLADSWGRPCDPGTSDEMDLTGSSMSLPLTFPGGITGAVSVADREDRTPFGTADRALLAHLTAFYASTFATPAQREITRLRGDLKTLRKQAIHAEENERQRLARELHDDVGHSITTAILSIDMTARGLPADGIAFRALTAVRDSLTDCADCLNEFAFQLRPRILNDLGVAPAVRGLARRVKATCALDVSVVVRGQERRLSDDTELTAFRVAQEAMTNALKHAHPTSILVHVTYSDGFLDIDVCDDGAGFDSATAKCEGGRHGQGLLGMRERAQLAGGVLEIQSVKGLGTTVHARLPVLGGRS